ncbi:hypothetical protein [Legionella pneumophila]|uniref:hypothetical protein n=1 Tax=Legionella pneumophila TaxID=446 RepID=UPI000AF213EE|nr:hypothetical protein [Legionella pneumophila]STX65047.1 Uncharacterised protein [Legionella pneumophila]STX65065.1 Uncharacterised protein [Legionella pneumophila]HAT2140296.1 hypothetical protein [Legionella pneumophila]HAT2149901.1 hypothetical protein [Legionella pneumophila]HAT2152834.1 hypothetical protein [Legionella pneumophila]
MQLNVDVTDRNALTTARQKWGGMDELVTCAAIDSPSDASSSKDNGSFEDDVV